MAREIEKRWKLEALNRRKFAKAKMVKIDQNYLDTPGYFRIRRTHEIKSNIDIPSYEFTMKMGSGSDRFEDTIRVNEDTALFLNDFAPGHIRKTRYILDGWEVDYFHNQLEGLIFLEYELKDGETEFPPLPNWAIGAVECTNTLDNKRLSHLVSLFGDDTLSVLNRPPIQRTILTGPPCAGKSTVISALNYQQKTVPEAATLLLRELQIENPSNIDAFQKTIYATQRTLEDLAFVETHYAKRSNLVLDRGTLDAASFISLDKFCSLNRTSKEIEYMRYDNVILLGPLDEEVFNKNKKSNPNRFPLSWDFAVENHARLKEVYKDHPNFIEIPGSRSLESKIKQINDVLTKEVAPAMGPFEKEFKQAAKSVEQWPEWKKELRKRAREAETWFDSEEPTQPNLVPEKK